MKKRRIVKQPKVQKLRMRLAGKYLIVLRGRKGYVMCGYLNLEAAEKFGDVAVRIVKVSTLRDALKATVESCTAAARQRGIYPGQPIKEVLAIIA